MTEAPTRVVTIAILDDYQQAARRYLPLDELRRICSPQVRIYSDRAIDEDQLVQRAGAAEVVVVMRERSSFGRAVIERLDATRLIVTSGSHNAAIDLAAAAERGVTVCGTRGRDAAPAELTWGLLLALIRRIPVEHSGILSGSWGVHVGQTLEGKRLGVLGLGEVGARVAGYGRAFGMDVLAHSRSLTRAGGVALGCSAVDRETLLRESDVVSLHLKLTSETTRSIGRRELGLMKRSAVLVNTARGALVDEAELVSALRAGRIAGAALDVFEHEPLPADSPLLGLENVVLTPHIGYVTDGRYREYYGQAMEIVADYVGGRTSGELR